jgi:hypothetical protein
MAFTGHSVAVVAPRVPGGGQAKVYIDGVYATTLAMDSSTARPRQIVFTRDFAAGGAHTIMIVAVERGWHPIFRLDAFVVSR